jgi:hypothetical protein
MALERGDEGEQTRLWRAIESHLQPPRVELDDGSELCGVRYDPGVRPTLTLVLRAAGPTAEDVQLHIRSVVTEPARWSTTMADPTIRQVALPLGLSPQRWRRGFLYAHRVTIRKRPGTERFEAYFDIRKRRSGRRGDAPSPKAGPARVEVLLLR